MFVVSITVKRGKKLLKSMLARMSKQYLEPKSPAKLLFGSLLSLSTFLMFLTVSAAICGLQTIIVVTFD